MKKLLLILALTLVLVFAFSAAASAATKGDFEAANNLLGDNVFKYHIITPHEYLGNVQIGNLWFENELYLRSFDVFVVEDDEVSLQMEAYTITRNVDFISAAYGGSVSYIDVRDGKARILPGYFENNTRGTQESPLEYYFSAYEEIWSPQLYVHKIYDPSFVLDEDEGDEKMLCWMSYAAIVFTKSQIAEIKSSGQLPPLMSLSENAPDALEYLDFSQLLALINGQPIPEITSAPAPEPAPTPQPEAATVNPTPSTVYVNGQSVAFEAYNIGGNNFFKLRDLAMALNETEKQFAVGYDEATKAITLTSEEPYTAVGGELTPGDGTAKTSVPTASKIYLNGEELELTVYNIGGNNFFKLRDLMQAIDVYVGYDEATKAITLDSSQGYSD